MQKIIIALTLICSFISLNASDYKILKLNNQTINIGNKILNVGDYFPETAVINWDKSKSTAMVIQKHGDKQQKILASKINKNTTVLDYIAITERLSSRGSDNIMSSERHINFPIYAISDFKYYLESDTLILIDSIYINTGWKTNDENYFKIRYTYNNQPYSVKLPVCNNIVTITKDILCPEIISKNTETLLDCQFEYVELDYDEITLITDKLKILYSPISINK